MAPRPSFKNEISDFRRALEPVGNDSERLLMLEVLDRWRDHPEAESLWEKISANQPSPPPRAFVAWLLDARTTSERVQQTVQAAPGVIAKARAVSNKDWKSGKFEQAALKARAAENFQNLADQVLGHKKSQAPRQRFMRLASEMFELNCGQPLDDVVASLTEIAFGGSVSAEVVRDARRSAKRHRDIRTPK
ncbi:hypothetical protein I6F30_25425 [Bradyrhizobium sp. NBAIM20]|uniref:hypothetical protein n=1 Tax=unclassified Bradyrhizobium TaxID=2631580 RepID=UPI001CD765EE|nr:MULTISPECIES: hypothetical protein [unclassified Bradyrhizobium]MCA1414467.1 hypothetical protein [Bradyrhizobium sp. NBAIM20]MCA1459871.1 hypothetical protein [Bradyrhizobium sp. NBAIM18]